ncbi:hypothetical protein niasHS_005970 [Heterodera schachtii]|uniref:Lon proteolytic domain-containing protein n=2 Tax=Heterodera TaxID=34509 RepID=A0ABD2JN82_HETSC
MADEPFKTWFLAILAARTAQQMRPIWQNTSVVCTSRPQSVALRSCVLAHVEGIGHLMSLEARRVRRAKRRVAPLSLYGDYDADARAALQKAYQLAVMHLHAFQPANTFFAENSEVEKAPNRHDYGRAECALAGFVALISLAIGRSPERFGLTGCIDPNGIISQVGGLEEKLMRLIHSGINNVLVPNDNHEEANTTRDAHDADHDLGPIPHIDFVVHINELWHILFPLFLDAQ